MNIPSQDPASQPPVGEANGPVNGPANGNFVNGHAQNGARTNGQANVQSNGHALPGEAPSSSTSITPSHASDHALATGYGASAMDYDDGGELHGFARVWRALSRRWPYALAVSSLILAGGTYYALTAPPLYRAAAIIEDITSGARGGSGGSGLDITEMLGGSQGVSIQTQIAKINSPWVEDGAKKRLSPRASGLVAKGSLLDTDASLQAGTNLITVSASAHDARVAWEMANRMCDEYIAQSLQRNRDAMTGSVSYVKRRLDEVGKQLERAQNDLRNYKERYVTMDLGAETQQIVLHLAEAQTALQALQAERAANALKLVKVRQLLAQTPEAKMVPGGIIPAPEVETLKAKLSELKLQLGVLQNDYKDNYPPVAALKDQIADLQKRIDASQKTQIERYVRETSSVHGQLAGQRAELESGIEASQSREKSLQSEVAKATARLQQLPQKEFGMTKLMANAAQLADTYKSLNTSYQSLRISEEAKVADARVTHYANTPEAPMAPNRSRIIVYALMLGLLAGTGLAVVLDTLDTRVRDEDDAKRAINLPILASVPLLKASAQGLLLRDDKPSVMLEHYRMLRTNISFSGIDAPIKSIVITSSVPNEGKSTCAANLAVAAALAGEPVLLVDCDLRRPTAHKLFGLPNDIGLTNVAMGTATLEDAIRDTDTPGLRVLAAGPATPNLFKLISSASMRATLQKLAATEGLVVFDTPPALGLADARVVSVVADATLLVVSCNEATRQAVVQTRDLLAQSGTHLIGILLNKVADAGGRNGYYSYYSNYLEEETDGKAGKKALKSK